MNTSRAAARLVIHGRVQGVWYRQSCANEAHRLGVAGWVRNLPDGSVEAFVEGERSALEALVMWCHRGPPRAFVERVVVDASEPVGAVGFEVRR